MSTTEGRQGSEIRHADAPFVRWSSWVREHGPASGTLVAAMAVWEPVAFGRGGVLGHRVC